MRLDSGQLDAVAEAVNIAFGRAVAALADPLRLRLNRREGVSDVFDEDMLRTCLTQEFGTSGDVVLTPVRGQLGALMGVVFKRTGAFKLANVSEGRAIDAITPSPEQAIERVRVLTGAALSEGVKVLSAQTKLELEAEPSQTARCHDAAQVVLDALPASLSRRARSFVCVIHPITTDDAAIAGEVFFVSDCSGLAAYLRSVRLAA